jgi:glycine/D-amino acid oxidase-like deaminating enzyme
VLCTGCGRLAREWFAHVPFTPAKGEMLSVRGCRLPAGQALNRGVWLIAGESGSARLGATYERGREDLGLTAAARDQLLFDAQELGAGDLEWAGQSAGVRLTLPDRLPVAGWHPHQSRLGILGGLGSKGSLWAPWLAKVWRENLADAMKRFPVEVSVERWLRGGDARAMRLSVEN